VLRDKILEVIVSETSDKNVYQNLNGWRDMGVCISIENVIKSLLPNF
jgi:hypothetical protein